MVLHGANRVGGSRISVEIKNSFDVTLSAQIDHLFDLKDFPFDSHKLKLDYRINKLPFRNNFDLKVCGCLDVGDEDVDLVDPKEHIPYYAKTKGNKDTPPCILAAMGKGTIVDSVLDWIWLKEKPKRVVAALEFLERFGLRDKPKKVVAALEFDPWLSAGPEFDILLPTDIEDQGTKEKPRVAFTIEIRRKSAYHVWNMAVETVISTIVFALVVIKTSNFGGRLATNVTVLFTLISFSNNRSSSLPKLPYGTYSGRHTFRCLLLVIFLIVANILVAKRERARPRRRFDRKIYRNAGIAWGIYNGVLLSIWLFFVLLPRSVSPKYVPRNREEGTKQTLSCWKRFWSTYLGTFLLFLIHLIV